MTPWIMDHGLESSLPLVEQNIILKTECFEGIDNYSEDDHMDYKVNIKVKIPADKHFDDVTIEFQDEGSTSVDVSIKNGMYLYDKDQLVDEIDQDLYNQLQEWIKKFSENENFEEVSYFETIPRSKFKQEKDHLIYTIKSVSMGYADGEEKGIVLDVTDFTSPLSKSKSHD